MNTDTFNIPPDSGGVKRLSAEHIQELAKSGVSPEFALAAGVYTETSADNIGNLLNWNGPAKTAGPALVCPFFDLDGRPMVFADKHDHRREYVQLKPTNPRLSKPTQWEPGGKPIKYESPVGSHARLYVPLQSREKVFCSTDLFILTEGTKKALAAAEAGFPVVALIGVNNWGGRKVDGKKESALNSDFHGINLKRRVVVICFDSDAALNKNVQGAESRLMEALRAEGANVVILRLPAGPDGAKVGLDDYIVANGVDAFKKLLADAVAAKPEGETETAEELKVKAVQALALIGRSQSDLWHDDGGAAWATVGRRSMRVRSAAYKGWLTNEFRKQVKDIPPGDALTNAMNLLEAEATWDKPEHAAHVRIGGHGGKVFVALYDDADTIIEIGPGWWRTCDEPPVRFARPPAAKALPMPERDGDLAALRELLNLPDDETGDEAFTLLTGWLVGCYQPDGPFPILQFGGDHGAAKSTTVKACKRLIDPAKAPLRKTPKESRDLMITAGNTWSLAFDNLSSLPQWFSDDLCCLATGGGFSTRELYANDAEAIFDAKRPVILAGIPEFSKSADLLDRRICVRLPAIAEDKRITETEFWAKFDAACPKLLGALLDRVAAGLKRLPFVHLKKLPRMADFARFAFACEGAASEEESPFLTAYASNRSDSQEQALENSPVALAVITFMEERTVWQGTATDLLTELSPPGPATDQKPKSWPTCPNDLTNKLYVIAADLRKVHGIEFTKGREANRGRRRFLKLSRKCGQPPHGSGQGVDEQATKSASDVNGYRKKENVYPADKVDKVDKQSRSSSSGRTKYGPNSHGTAAKGGGL